MLMYIFKREPDACMLQIQSGIATVTRVQLSQGLFISSTKHQGPHQTACIISMCIHTCNCVILYLLQLHCSYIYLSYYNIICQLTATGNSEILSFQWQSFIRTFPIVSYLLVSYLLATETIQACCLGGFTDRPSRSATPDVTSDRKQSPMGDPQIHIESVSKLQVLCYLCSISK